MNLNNIYAETVFVETSGMNGVTVSLNGIDLSDIVMEAGTTQLLEEMDLSDVHDWVQEKLKENREDAEN